VTEPTETARELLWRHNLPEDVIDGALCLHAQELAAVQREAIRKTDDPVFYEGEAGWLVGLIEPEDAPAVSAGVATASSQAAPAVWIDGHPQLEAIAAAVWERCGRSDSGTCVEDDPRNIAVAALAAVLPTTTDRAGVEAPEATCSAQNRNYESGPRLCIRAAQHHGDHIDERGFHWSDTVAVYPVAGGTFRTGINVRAELRRVAAEAGPADTGEDGGETEGACPRCKGSGIDPEDDLIPGSSWELPQAPPCRSCTPSEQPAAAQPPKEARPQ
jgi:hypothetical protein